MSRSREVQLPHPPIAALALFGATAVAMLLATAAPAKTYLVTKRGDPVPGACKPRDCSLREAVMASSARLGGDTIELPNRRKAYVLTQPGTAEDGSATGDLDIANDPLMVKHPGKGRATGQGLSSTPGWPSVPLPGRAV